MISLGGVGPPADPRSGLGSSPVCRLVVSARKAWVMLPLRAGSWRRRVGSHISAMDIIDKDERSKLMGRIRGKDRHRNRLA